MNVLLSIIWNVVFKISFLLIPPPNPLQIPQHIHHQLSRLQNLDVVLPTENPSGELRGEGNIHIENGVA